MKIHNFSAGPSILPQEVFTEASKAILNFGEMGMSLLEISHRSDQFVAVMEEAMSLVSELLNLPSNYKVMFLSGGASMQFCMIPMNLLKEGGKAAYIDTGTWANKAIKEAKLFGDIDVVASSKDSNYNYIPKEFNVPSDAQYLHITSNNTIFGTQYQQFPQVDVPMVGDMSSDIFSRSFDASKFGLIYAGAQKNMGPAGTTLVIVNEELLGKSGRKLPSMLDYAVHIKNESMFNTPPVFPIYVSMLVMRWIKEQGGITAVQEANEKKAMLLYDEIDNNPLFKGTARVEDRSRMNVCFLLEDESHHEEFMNLAVAGGVSGIIGHRSVGGYRASIYNAMSYESVAEFVEIMKEFAISKG